MVLSGCTQSAWSWVPGVYRIDIQQGNAVTDVMVSQLQPGMTKRQVAYVMGTPLIQDAFHKDRWDYIYTMAVGGEEREGRRITLYFDKDLLAGVDGDFRPSDEPVIVTAPHSSVVVPPRELDHSLWGYLRRSFEKN
ncbi:outer membrane protein assembly factor BamE [Methylogaea oryzae]|nr:outer membrane protein assembly factor BamE [Methylogaea oryzae]